MIVADNNALNSYLKTPPFFGTGREAPSVFEVSAPRRVPDTLQDRGTEHERDAAERHRTETPPLPATLTLAERDRRDARYARSDYQPLTRLYVAREGQLELDPNLSRAARIRASLERSGGLPEQLVTAGGHAFEASVQARATLIASRVHGATDASPG